MTAEMRNKLVLWMMGDCFRMDTEAYKGYYQRYVANGYRHIKSDPVYQEMAAECRLRYPGSYLNCNPDDVVYMGRPSAYARQALGGENPQYAENEYAGTKGDGEDRIDDSSFIKLMGENLIKTEGVKGFIYLDINGHITAGIGTMLDKEKSFKNMDWEIDGRKATKEEIDKAYQIFMSLKQEKNSDGKPKYFNYKAEYFKRYSKLRLSKGAMIKIMSNHLSDDLKRARKELQEFDELPLPIRVIIIDFYYNKGNIKRQKGFKDSLKSRNRAIFRQSIIRGMPDRDKWTLEQFGQIPKSFWK